MEAHYYYVKYMVSDECMETVSKLVKQLDLPITAIEPGRVTLAQPLKKAVRIKLQKALQKESFFLINNKDAGMVNHAKCWVKKIIHHHKDKEGKVDFFFSKQLAEKMGIPYQKLNLLFLYAERCSLNNYVAKQRVQRAKQLLTEYGGRYKITDISTDLGYNSPEYLCMQFKKITGVTIGNYRSMGMVKERKMFSLR